MSWTRAVVLLLSLGLGACSSVHERIEDAGPDAGHRDAGPFDAAGVDCERQGSFCRCTISVARECDAIPDHGCHHTWLVCMPRPLSEPSGRGRDVCSFADGAEPESSSRPVLHCWSDRICLTGDGTFEDGRLGGGCVEPWLCEAAVESELPGRCRYSDGSVYERAPPAESCPPAPNERTPFCGGECGSCPYHRPPPLHWGGWGVHCVGRSETRGLGACTFGELPCLRGEPTAALSPLGGCQENYGDDCACLRERGSSGELRDWGWPTLAGTCRAYRARYPGAVECMDPIEWEPLAE